MENAGYSVMQTLKKIFPKGELPFRAKRACGILLAVYLVALLPLLRADYNYNDDIGRNFLGQAAFGYSRYISDFLAHIVHAGDYLTDISPLPQLMAIVLLVLASVILLSQVAMAKGQQEITLWDCVTVIPLGLSPYYLECLSYKYDSPYMALSVFASVAPLALRRKNRGGMRRRSRRERWSCA